MSFVKCHLPIKTSTSKVVWVTEVSYYGFNKTYFYNYLILKTNVD